jgi:Patatin-like phospholipase
MFGSGSTSVPWSYEEVLELEYDYIRARRKLPKSEVGTPEYLTALCLSGGGVRSASFCLGVIRKLAKGRHLSKFDYLSTVSGGGFIGGFLVRWAHEIGLSNVETELESGDGFGRPGSPLYHLRQYISYLTPKLGIFSLDSLAGLGLFARNLIINWLIIIPFLFLLVQLPQIVALFFTAHFKATPFWGVIIVSTLGLLAISETMPKRPSFTYFGNKVSDPPFASLFGFFSAPIFALSGIAAGLLGAYGITGARLFKNQFNIEKLTTCLGNDHNIKNHEALKQLVCIVENYSLWSLGMATAIGCVFVIFAMTYAQSQHQANKSKTAIILLMNGFAVFAQALSLIVFMISAGYLLQNVELTDGSPQARVEFTIAFFPISFAAAFFLSELVYDIVRRNPPWGDMEREWTARSTGALIALPLAWLFICICSFWGTEIVTNIQSFLPFMSGNTEHANLFDHGLLTLVTGAISLIFANHKNIRLVFDETVNTWKQIGTRWMLYVVLFLFAFLLLSLLGNVASSIPKPKDNPIDRLSVSVVYFSILTFLLFAFDWLIILNKYTLHSIYRNRVVRGFLGASNQNRKLRIDNREPRGFLDYDKNDNVELHLFDITANGKSHNSSVPPLHLVNMSLNIPGSSELVTQERKSLPFTASSIAVGSFALPHLRAATANPISGSYRRATEYAGKRGKLTLGTVLAISGAAFDPHLGQSSHPALRLMLTFFNVRLGVWLGNPSQSGSNSYREDGPALMLIPLLQEFAGLANEHRAYVHLSDGGHFENLGLYEMLKRKCRFIVIVDAGCDPVYSFEDLGKVQRIARADLGAVLNFEPTTINSFKGSASYILRADVMYDDRSVGKILLVKPKFTENCQPEVFAYHKVNPSFPHDPTANQFFTESQFLAYLNLGEEAGDELNDNIESTYQLKQFREL